jgi:transposase
MAPRYDSSLRQLVTMRLRDGVSPLVLARQLQLHMVTVYRYQRSLQIWNQIHPPLVVKQGRPRVIHQAAEDELMAIIDIDSVMYLNEMTDHLWEEFEIYCSISTISRVLKRLRVTRKITERPNSARDNVLRAHWQAKMTEYSAAQLVVVDESAANERTGDRRWGWSERGNTCRVTGSGIRSTRWSILPAIGINGYLDYEIYHGSFNAERFNGFIQRLLTKMEPFPGPRSVLVMDNAPIHGSQELRDLCRERGVILEHLPPYSPDFSPIESSFHSLKAWMRRNRELMSLY